MHMRILLVMLLAEAVLVAGSQPAVSGSGPLFLDHTAKPHPKLESQLSQLVDEYRRGGSAAAQAQAGALGAKLEGQRVRVIVQVQPGREAQSAADARAQGGRVEATYGDLVQVLAPLGTLEALADEESVRFVRQPLRSAPATVTGEGVALIKADDWQGAGIDGSGVKVAVLDLGFQGYASLLGSELPSSVVTHSCRADSDITGGGEPHGTAVAEIVYEVAPGASLYLVNFDTEVELGNCVDWLIAQGVDVINHSVGWFGTGPGDGTGPINDMLNSATASGILWANAAGNQAQNHWSGVWSDPDGDDFHNFAGDDPTNSIFAFKDELIVAVLRWDDPWAGSCNDYNLYLLNASLSVLTASIDEQSCSQDPVEGLSWVAQTSGFYHIAINRFSGVPVALDLHAFHSLQYQVAAGSLLEPADNPDVATVGAVRWSSPGTVEPFSSQGPTSDGRTKPDIVAPDGVSNATYGSFLGTSASSPHAAGAAALVWQLYPCFSRANVQSLQEERAVELGAPGKDNIYGSGRLDLALPIDTDGDGLGDACDPDIDGDGIANAEDLDADGNGVRNPDETACGSDPLNGSLRPERVDGAFSGVDDDGDTVIDEALPPGASVFDCDGDGFRGSAEDHVYSPSTQGDQDPCGGNSSPPTDPPSPIGWPADLFGQPPSDNHVDVQDLTSFLAPIRHLDTSPGKQGYDIRWDIYPGAGTLGDHINVQDLTALLVVYPPMLNHARAFDGSACPWSP